MTLKLDNGGAKDLIDNWTIGGRTRHIETKQCFLRELKEQGVIEAVWIPGETNTADIGTKNLGRKLFERHAKVMVGDDEYMKKEETKN